VDDYADRYVACGRTPADDLLDDWQRSTTGGWAHNDTGGCARNDTEESA
jgi:hypothetical protein